VYVLLLSSIIETLLMICSSCFTCTWAQKLQETLTKTNEEHIELLEGIKAAKKQLKTSEQNNKELKAAMENLTTDAKEGLIVAEQECQTDESSEMIVNQVRRCV